MKRLLALAILGLALVTVGCAGTEQAKKEQAITEDTMVRCPKCGAEFKVREHLWEKP